MSIKFQTDQSGANNNVCSGSSTIFNFSVATDTAVDQGDFVIKKGSGTTDSILATIHNGANGSGSVVESVTVLASSVTQSFSTIPFIFTNANLIAGATYSLVISSTSSCSGNSPYSIKTGNFEIINAGVIINTGYGIGANLNIITTTSSNCSLSTKIIKTINNITTLSSSANISTLISPSINNYTLVTSSAIVTKPTPSYIKINSYNQTAKVYLGSQHCKIYRGNQLLINIP